MFDRLSRSADAERVEAWWQPNARGGFQVLFPDQPEEVDAVVEPLVELIPEPPAAPPAPTPEEIAADAFAQGFAEGSRIGREEAAGEHAAMTSLALALGQLRPVAPGLLAAMLTEAVVELTRSVAGAVDVDADLLRDRCRTVASLFDGHSAGATLFVATKDLALVADADLGISVAADPALSRGSVRLMSDDRIIEDGVELRLEQVRQAVRGQGQSA